MGQRGHWISHRIRLNDSLEVDLRAWNETCSDHDIRQTSIAIVQGDEPYWAILAFIAAPDALKRDSDSAPSGEGTPRLVPTPEEAPEFERLRAARASSAREHSCAAYMIANDQELVRLMRARPTTLSDLLRLPGYKERRAARYGESILGWFGHQTSGVVASAAIHWEGLDPETGEVYPVDDPMADDD